MSQPVLEETVRNFIEPSDFHQYLQSKGTSFYAGVPDSLLMNFCAYVQEECPRENHLIAANEGSAIAAAAGNYLATGQIPCVYMQNSGLGNAVNPIMSLVDHRLYQIPMLLMVGWRGQPGRKDEPQHVIMGDVTQKMLETMGVPFEILPDYMEGAEKAIDKAYEYMMKHKGPFALLITRATFADYKAPEGVKDTFVSDIRRESAIEAVARSINKKSAVVATTGFTSRELFELRERYQEGHGKDFLTIGSMGHASSIALGLAVGQPNRDIVCLDGDGAMIMHLGNLAVAGASNLKNFKHVVLNNGVHDSVGGQPTSAAKIDLKEVAKGMGYAWTKSVSSLDDLEDAVEELDKAKGPALLEVKLELGTRANLGRPTTSPVHNKNAFMEFLGSKHLFHPEDSK